MFPVARAVLLSMRERDDFVCVLKTVCGWTSKNWLLPYACCGLHFIDSAACVLSFDHSAPLHKEQLLKIQKLHNKQTSNIRNLHTQARTHARAHTHTLLWRIYLFRNAIDFRIKLCFVLTIFDFGTSCRAVGAGPVTFPAQNAELCPLLCGAQHCFSVIMFLWLSRLVAAPGQPSETFLGWGLGRGKSREWAVYRKMTRHKEQEK